MNDHLLFRDSDLLAIAFQWATANKDFAIATVISTWGSAPRQVGSFMVIDRDGQFYGSVSGGCVENAVVVQAQDAMNQERAHVIEFGLSDDDVLSIGLACGGQIQILIEPSTANGLHWVLEASQAVNSRSRATLIRHFERNNKQIAITDLKWLSSECDEEEYVGKNGFVAAGNKFVQSFQVKRRVLIIGGVHIAQALVRGLNALDFETFVIDPRTVWANKERFPDTQVINSWPEDALAEIQIDRDTAVVALTHDPKFDDPAITTGLRSDAFYVGALGGLKSADARRLRLLDRGLTDAEIDRLHSPIGVSIGAKGPAEITIAILAELIRTYRNVP